VKQSVALSDQGRNGLLSSAVFLLDWRHRPLLIIFLGCLSIEIALVILDLSINWYKWSETNAIRRLFNITREDGLASLFAVLQTVAVASVLWLTWFLTRAAKAEKRNQTGWLIVALFLSYIAIDDGALVHERIGTAFQQNNGGISLVSYGWQYVMGPIFALMGIIMFGFLWRQGNNAIRRDWLVIAFACMGTAILLDFFEGMENGYQVLVNMTGWRTKTITHFAKSFEEFLEMLGMSILLVLFLHHFGYLAGRLEIRIVAGKISVTKNK
jgi:hypothetical protein